MQAIFVIGHAIATQNVGSLAHFHDDIFLRGLPTVVTEAQSRGGKWKKGGRKAEDRSVVVGGGGDGN